MGIVVLNREEIYFIDRLAGTEIYLHPVRIGIGCRIIPTTAGSPVQSFAIAVIDRGDRIVATVS